MASKGISEKFHPPVTLILPKRMFGSKKVERAFRANWCQQFPWLHYNIDRDAAFCHVCMQADNEGKFLSSSKRESSFITDGFTNWKEATCSFRRHQQSKSHLEAVEAIITTPKQSADIGELLNHEHLEQKKTNRAMFFLQFLENIRFLARQGLPLRNTFDDDSNFGALLSIQSKQYPDLKTWVEKKKRTSIHHMIFKMNA